MIGIARQRRERDWRSPFQHRRKLRVFIDSGSLDGRDDVTDVIVGFCSHELIELYAPDKFANATEVTTTPTGSGDALLVRAGSVTSLIPAPPAQWDRIADELHTRQLGVDRRELHRQLLVLQMASALWCDVLVTHSDLLRGALPEGLIKGSGAMTPSEALAVVGLFLRSRGEFLIDADDTYRESVSSSLFYWLLARALVPASWPWFGACVRHSAVTSDDTLLLLGQSAIQRLDRALRARDRLLQQVQRGMDRDALDDALFYLDVVLLMLGGALDATARVAHMAYELPTNMRTAGWRRGDWLSRLAQVDRQLAASMNQGTESRDVVDVIATLRNTIHAEALQGLEATDAARPLDSDMLVRIPQRDETVLLDRIGRRGGPARWGVSDLGGGYITLEPATFVEMLIPRAAAVINDLIAQTDHARLVPGDEEEIVTAPLPDDRLFGSTATRNVLLLAGFGQPGDSAGSGSSGSTPRAGA